jgi:hypothetical protein
VSLHEVGHGLFWSGSVSASRTQKTASFSSGASVGRFDTFLAASSKASVSRSCTRASDFYNAITNSGLRFTDPTAPGTDFGLYSPTDYTSGSSVYHHDPVRLASDCETNGIPPSECSDIMTNQLINGYTQRTVGEPVRRMMNAMRGSSRGPAAGSCDVPAGTVAAVSSASTTEKPSAPQFPRWGIYAISGAGIAVLALIGVVCVHIACRSAK